MKICYFDNCATTRIDDGVLAKIEEYQRDRYFNPSARSSASLLVSNEMALSREKIAKSLGAQNMSVYFTSGGTESDNIAIFGAVKSRKGNIVATMSEHSAVYNTLLELQSRGYQLRLAKVSNDGHIDVEDFLSKVDADTVLACFMHVNNETGAINDVKDINDNVKSKNPRTITFSDGIQAVGKIPVNLANLGVDLYTLSGHKFHAGKGCGALFVKNGVKISSLVYGGGQEKGMRSGTEYVGGAIALGDAVQLAVANVPQNTQKFLHFKEIIRNAISDAHCRELCVENCSPAIMTLAFENIKGEVLLHMLESYGIIVGTGSACSSKNKQSRIAKAIGLEKQFVEGVIRLSFSKYNTEEEVIFLAEKLKDCSQALRATMFGK